jgi:hypothetical protein
MTDLTSVITDLVRATTDLGRKTGDLALERIVLGHEIPKTARRHGDSACA